jgi:nitroreductase
MDYFRLIRERRSIRAFAPKPVEEHLLRQVLEAANAAPSAGNLQAYEIFVVRKPEDRKKLAEAALWQDFIAAAPVVLVFCANPARNEARYRQRGQRLYSIQDATIACTFAMLAVTALGLASVWVGAFRDDDVRQVIGAPSHMQPVAILPIGLGAESPGPTPRRRLRDLVHEVRPG